ncbi:hypothetical protein CB0940_00037 [Cercospora beticola]|uniref:Uncharacterized protein n=1 Tax=Cercospora beticola TaxID=122368 RepID=A0A2G5I7J4_CERBT|nr:hypothetical protein CB0940_00037 [Cercospora beticola]PIB00777.1 hypothetical protein CB0940_00037 [Cercospora beticola]WPA95440.1 hypothetical protein RHO25_000039 [Cercospora beticola]CAK1356345.1 unnamed protein product [Cercospora beticola]
MISSNSFKLAIMTALSVSSAAAPLQRVSDCGWLGCGIQQQQKPLSSYSLSHGGAEASDISAANIVEAIKSLTAKTQELGAPANTITATNGPLLVIGEGPYPVVIKGFVDIVNQATLLSGQLFGAKPITAGGDADSISDAWKEFSQVSAVLLRVLTSKAGLLEDSVPLIGRPMVAVLRKHDSLVDTLAFTFINLVQNKASDISASTEDISKALRTAIQAYEG